MVLPRAEMAREWSLRVTFALEKASSGPLRMEDLMLKGTSML